VKNHWWNINAKKKLDASTKADLMVPRKTRERVGNATLYFAKGFSIKTGQNEALKVMDFDQKIPTHIPYDPIKYRL